MTLLPDVRGRPKNVTRKFSAPVKATSEPDRTWENVRSYLLVVA
jgi:hypothetical protein